MPEDPATNPNPEAPPVPIPNATPGNPPTDPAPANPNPNSDDKPELPEAAKADDETTALGKKPEAAEPEAKVELPDIIGAPEGDYTIEAPEGRELDKEALDAVAPLFKEMNLSQKGVQQVVNAYAEKVLPIIEQRMQDASAVQIAQYRKEWLDEAKADPEIGGPKWDESLAIAGKVFDKVGIAEADPFRVLLEESGLGNNKDAIRFMVRLGKLIGEDSFVPSDTDANADTRPIYDRIYGGPTPAS